MLKRWLVFLLAISGSSSVFASSLATQRLEYDALRKLQQSGQWSLARQGFSKARDYPLYVYLEYFDLREQAKTLTVARVQQFQQQFAYSALSQRLGDALVSEWGKSGRFRDIMAIKPQLPNGAAAQCYWTEALWRTKGADAAIEQSKKLWLVGGSVDSACDGLFSLLQKSRYYNNDLVWQRLMLAFANGQDSLVSYLSKQLTDVAYQQDAAALQRFSAKPIADNLSQLQVKSPRADMMLEKGIYRLANAQPEQAMVQYDRHVARFSADGKKAIADRLVRKWLDDTFPANIRAWRDARIVELQDPALTEWRLRRVIRDQQWAAMPKWLDAAEKANVDEHMRWYWQARWYQQQGKHEQAKQLLQQTAQHRSYYGLLAAERLGVPYALDYPQLVQGKGKLDARVEGLVRELYHRGDSGSARSEFLFHINQLTDQQAQLQACVSAYHHGWWHLSVMGSIEADAWGQLDLRFPPGFDAEFSRFARERGVDKTLLMALSRQESGLDQLARSPVGARGLMQLMPATARQVAKQLSYPYSSEAQLNEVDTNIAFGSHYIAAKLARYNGNRVLALSAYNAGPHRADTWQKRYAGLPLDAFVESIPFNETRRYVKNIFAYQVFYQHLLQQKPAFLTAAERRWLQG